MDQRVCSNREPHGEKKTGIATTAGTLYSQKNAPESSQHQHRVPTDSIAPSCASIVSPSPLPIKLIPIELVCDMLGLKRSATLEMVRKGILPKPIKFGTSRRSAARWVLHEICDFILEKAAERNIVDASSRSTEVSK